MNEQRRSVPQHSTPTPKSPYSRRKSPKVSRRGSRAVLFFFHTYVWFLQNLTYVSKIWKIETLKIILKVIKNVQKMVLGSREPIFSRLRRANTNQQHRILSIYDDLPKNLTYVSDFVYEKKNTALDPSLKWISKTELWGRSRGDSNDLEISAQNFA